MLRRLIVGLVLSALATAVSAQWGNELELTDLLGDGFKLSEPYDPFESYTIKPGYSGGYKIQHDYNPMQSWTVKPRYSGGYKIQHDYNPMESYTIKRTFSGNIEITNDYNPLDTTTIRIPYRYRWPTP